MSRPVTWRAITFERCAQMLDMVPPPIQTPLGFLMGEAVSERICRVTGRRAITYPAFAETDALGAYEASVALTVAEFRALTVRDVLDNRAPEPVNAEGLVRGLAYALPLALALDAVLVLDAGRLLGVA